MALLGSLGVVFCWATKRCAVLKRVHTRLHFPTSYWQAAPLRLPFACSSEAHVAFPNHRVAESQPAFCVDSSPAFSGALQSFYSCYLSCCRQVDGDPNFHLQGLWDDVVDVKRDLVEDVAPASSCHALAFAFRPKCQPMSLLATSSKDVSRRMR